ncbi:MAG: hypothetical protein JWM38_1639 [Sphingomonas bacterium]|nr:hypothetical protein [Sphingomonas bacterium]MDB5685301.1 hypothetical protein [Sphingomonas bacterium]MDB5718212.1 hypothetical protein [Sphingomonas bacterium]
MTKFVALALLAAAITTPAFAATDAAPAETSFTRDGRTYFVKETDMGAYTLIAGRDSTGRTFNFRLTGQRVTGHYNNEYMEFTAPAAAHPAKLASR